MQKFYFKIYCFIVATRCFSHDSCTLKSQDISSHTCLSDIQRFYCLYIEEEMVVCHCVKSVGIWSYSGPYFLAFGLKLILFISSYSIRLRENKYQKISEYGHFLRSVSQESTIKIKLKRIFVLMSRRRYLQY